MDIESHQLNDLKWCINRVSSTTDEILLTRIKKNPNLIKPLDLSTENVEDTPTC